LRTKSDRHFSKVAMSNSTSRQYVTQDKENEQPDNLCVESQNSQAFYRSLSRGTRRMTSCRDSRVASLISAQLVPKTLLNAVHSAALGPSRDFWYSSLLLILCQTHTKRPCPYLRRPWF